MTICIAAIGSDENDEEFIVFTTDHMISFQASVSQFEHAIEKYKAINPTTVIMFSGDTLLFDEIMSKYSDGEKPISEVAEDLHTIMQEIRTDRIERQLLKPIGYNRTHIPNIAVAPIQNDVQKELLDKIVKSNLQSFLLVIGFDEDGVAQMFEVNEFVVNRLREINFSAIGSGAIQAFNTLLSQKHSKKDDLPTTVYNVYKAKRNSEVSVGVGKETDLLLLHKDGLRKAGPTCINELSEIYLSELRYGKEKTPTDIKGKFEAIDYDS